MRPRGLRLRDQVPANPGHPRSREAPEPQEAAAAKAGADVDDDERRRPKRHLSYVQQNSQEVVLSSGVIAWPMKMAFKINQDHFNNSGVHRLQNFLGANSENLIPRKPHFWLV